MGLLEKGEAEGSRGETLAAEEAVGWRRRPEAAEDGRGGCERCEKEVVVEVRGEGGRTGFEETRSRTREMEAAVGAAKREKVDGVVVRLFVGEEEGEKKLVVAVPGVEGVGERRGRRPTVEVAATGVPCVSSSFGSD